MNRAGLALVALAALVCPTRAEIRLPAIIQSGMVLQRDKPVWIWGEATPGTTVEVGFAGRPYRWGFTDDEGRWRVLLEPHSAGGPFALHVRGDGEVLLEDVLVGDVWLCSGQSNMEQTVGESADRDAVLAAADDAELRLFLVEKALLDDTRDDVRGDWLPATAESVEPFSAVGYHLGRELRATQGVPVGLIDASWGGTPAEAWTPREAVEAHPEFAGLIARSPSRVRPQLRVGALWESLVEPYAGFGLRGVAWYQGEANAAAAELYREQLPTLIRSWRRAFGQGDLPFVYVQLPRYRARRERPSDGEWAELREAQALALALPRTAMAVTIDQGGEGDLHPADKRPFGRRLALCARAVAHGEDVAWSGPRLDHVELEVSWFRVVFRDHVGEVTTSDGEPPRGFAVAGEDRVFHWADEWFWDEDGLRLRCEAVPDPVALRYAWADNPDCNLCDEAGLFAGPFRTDDWPGLTTGKR